MANRDDVLSDFTIEEEMSPAVLKDYLQRYPEYTKDLLALFNELSLSDLEATEANVPLETKAMTAETIFSFREVCSTPKSFLIQLNMVF